MAFHRLLFFIFFMSLFSAPTQGLAAVTFGATGTVTHPVEMLVGEQFSYDVSFLWFKRLAEGTISLQRGEAPGTYLAIMEARTLGIAAFFTKNRVERYQTTMEIGPDGVLRPLVHSSHTFKGQGKTLREKKTTYTFDYVAGKVGYKKIKSNRITADELLPLGTDGPVFDILSALYNLRLGTFGSFAEQRIYIPTFHRKGIEDIVIAPAGDISRKDKKFFSKSGTLCKVLVDPSIFKTKGRELLISFDEQNRLQKGIVKNVIGLGDVKGVLRPAPVVAQLPY